MKMMITLTVIKAGGNEFIYCRRRYLITAGLSLDTDTTGPSIKGFYIFISIYLFFSLNLSPNIPNHSCVGNKLWTQWNIMYLWISNVRKSLFYRNRLKKTQRK